MDFKALLTNPLILAGLAGGAGYYFGPKYHKEKGRLYGTIAGAGLGYLVAKYWLAPKVAPPAQLPEQAQQSIDQQVGEILGDYVDIDAYDDVRAAPPQRPQAPRAAQQQPMSQQQARRAPQAPPPGVDDLSDLQEGWGNGGSFSGGLGNGTSDRELDELFEIARRRGN